MNDSAAPQWQSCVWKSLSFTSLAFSITFTLSEDERDRYAIVLLVMDGERRENNHTHTPLCWDIIQLLWLNNQIVTLIGSYIFQTAHKYYQVEVTLLYLASAD